MAACRHTVNPSYFPKGKHSSSGRRGGRKRARRASPGDEGEGEDGMNGIDPDEFELEEDDGAEMECEECSD